MGMRLLKKLTRHNVLRALERVIPKERVFNTPMEIILETTNRCNATCSMCNRNFFAKGNHLGFLSQELFEKTLPLMERTPRLLLGGFGETLLHPRFLEMARRAKRTRAFCYFISNGTLLREEIARELVDLAWDQVVISFDGGTEETFRKVRGLPFEKVRGNVERLSRVRAAAGSAKPGLRFNVMGMKSTIVELPLILRIARDLGVAELCLQPLVVEGPELLAESCFDDVPRWSAALHEAAAQARASGIAFFGEDMLEERKKNCFAFLEKLFVAWNGEVYTCSHEKFVVGDLNQRPLEQIWNDAALRGLRRRWFQGGIASTCPDCFEWDHSRRAFESGVPHNRDYAVDLLKSSAGEARGVPLRRRPAGSTP